MSLSMTARGGSALIRALKSDGLSRTSALLSATRGSASSAAVPAAVETLQNVKDGKVLHPDLLNENILKTQYAVRGELYLRAEELRRAGKEIIFTNVGNPQALGQTPLTFNRQVSQLKQSRSPRHRNCALSGFLRLLFYIFILSLCPKRHVNVHVVPQPSPMHEASSPDLQHYLCFVHHCTPKSCQNRAYNPSYIHYYPPQILWVRDQCDKCASTADRAESFTHWGDARALLLRSPMRQTTKPLRFSNPGSPCVQVMALVTGAHFMLKDPEFRKMFKDDVVARAEQIMTQIPGGVGAYSDSRGSLGIRQEVSNYIAERDGVPGPNPDHIFLTDGASVAVRMGLSAMIRNSNDGIMVPIPQYPLYSASIALYGGSLVPYSLDEDNLWSMDMARMKKSVDSARAEGKNVRALVFINPGNPTGQCLTRENLQELVQFAYDEKIVLLCDEVYQENIYQDERPFISARQVAYEMGEPVRSGLEMMCFHTVSKGTLGECGLRGGYVEMVNIHEDTVNEVYKVASINLSPNVPGQVAMSLMVNPPKPGMPSYDQFRAEKDEILSTLRERAHIMTDGFNSLEGVTCNFTEGAMYSFPQIRLSPKAMEAADAAGKSADVFYCLKLLEATGISTVPGSGFGQEPGTFHLRTTILPPVEKMKEVVRLLQDFHSKFMDEYR